MKPHQNDDDMRITTSADVLIGLQDRIAALECIADDLQALCDKQALMLGERDAQLEAVGAGGVGARVPTNGIKWPQNAADIREFIGSNFNSATFPNAPENMGYSAVMNSEPSDNDKYSVSAHDLLSSFSEWSEYHDADQLAPTVVEPDGYCIPESEQFTFSKSRPFAKAWRPFYLAAPPSHQIAEPASPWVSVSERLPVWVVRDDTPCFINGKEIPPTLFSETVLVALKGGGVRTDKLTTIEGKSEGWWHTYGERVAAWMLAPKPPTQKEPS